MITLTLIDTPLGPMHLEEEDGAVVRLDFVQAPSTALPLPLAGEGRGGGHPVARYFAGELAALDELRLAPRGTPFQRRVWEELRKIPAGKTTSYGAIARALGSSARAVGSANGRNPIALAIPCHRVIGADGSLTGYAGGMHRKEWLLAHESRATRATLF